MTTKLLRPVLLFLGFAAGSAFGQPLTLPDASPRASVAQTIGITTVVLDYGRPNVGKREIWGKLVPYGYNDLGFGTSKAAPWRAGANMNTTISVQHDVKVAGQPLKAGTYGLSMALTETGGVTVIFSTNSSKWGSFFYDPAEDALRVETKWEDAPFHEQLAYEFTDVTKTSANLALLWEKKRIPISITVDTDAVVVANLKRELTTAKGFTSLSWSAAADYVQSNNLDLNLALEWAEHAVSGVGVGQKNFATLAAKAGVLLKLKRAAEARATMDEAMPFGTVLDVHQYGRRLLAAGEAAHALEVFKFNAQKHPNTWPVNYGLARGLSAVGDYPAALAALLQAQKEIPAGDTLNGPAIQANIEKLKRGENIN